MTAWVLVGMFSEGAAFKAQVRVLGHGDSLGQLSHVLDTDEETERLNQLSEHVPGGANEVSRQPLPTR